MTKMTEGKKNKASTEDAVPHNDTTGEALRVARVGKGKTIEEVSAALRIRHTQLRAIEENNIEALPGITYAVGFVRSYANYLGLNGNEMVNKFKAEHGYSPAQSKLDFPAPVAESRMPDPLIIGVGAFLAILVLAVWTFYSSMESPDIQKAEQIQTAPQADNTAAVAAPATTPAPEAQPANGATPVPATDASAAAAPAAPVDVTAPAPAAAPAPAEAAATAAPAPAEVTPAPAAPDVTAAAPAAAEAVTAAVPAEAAPAEAKKEEPKKEGAKKSDDVIQVKHGKSRITLRANQASWVQVTNNDGDVIYKKVLRPGDQYMVPDQPGMSLVTSNAGGLDISVDGQKVQSIGSQGEIVRGIALEPGSLKKKRTKVSN